MFLLTCCLHHTVRENVYLRFKTQTLLVCLNWVLECAFVIPRIKLFACDMLMHCRVTVNTLKRSRNTKIGKAENSEQVWWNDNEIKILLAFRVKDVWVRKSARIVKGGVGFLR